jgi:sugar lactone lactonase YvrE
MKNSTRLLGLATSILLSNAVIASDAIVIENEGLYPEGISFDEQQNLFYVSSVGRGEIWRVDRQGNAELFARHPDIASTIGLQVDNDTHRLLVCVSDPGLSEQSQSENVGIIAGLAVFDLPSGKRLAYHDLASVAGAGGHFANDVTVDEQGNIYVTDSFSPVIYRIADNGSIDVIAQYPQLQVSPGQFGLNGIVYHSDGFLIVAHHASGKLYRIDIDNPELAIEISRSGMSEEWQITGLDGLLLIDSTTLAAVNNDSSERHHGNVVYQLVSDDGWLSYRVDAAMPTTNTFPTTLTQAGDDLFVLHSQLPVLFSGNASPARTFDIEKVLFDVSAEK